MPPRLICHKKASTIWSTPDTGKNDLQRYPQRWEGLAALRSSFNINLQLYRFIPITVSSMVSTVVMVFELAWNPRCVAIICTNSRDMSTLDCSIL